jgi:hypothetical protein
LERVLGSLVAILVSTVAKLRRIWKKMEEVEEEDGNENEDENEDCRGRLTRFNNVFHNMGKAWAECSRVPPQCGFKRTCSTESASLLSAEVSTRSTLTTHPASSSRSNTSRHFHAESIVDDISRALSR